MRNREDDADCTKNWHGDVECPNGILLLLDVYRCGEAYRVVAEPNSEQRTHNEARQKDIRESDEWLNTENCKRVQYINILKYISDIFRTQNTLILLVVVTRLF